jgi:high-affinity K+ transport system ATPase subunit B
VERRLQKKLAIWLTWITINELIEIVEIGKQLLMTRGTLTTFSIANDVAKYFAIVPALFMASIRHWKV